MSLEGPSSSSPLVSFSPSLDPFNAPKSKRKEKEDYSAKRSAKKPRTASSQAQQKREAAQTRQIAAKALQQLSVTPPIPKPAVAPAPAASPPSDSPLHKNTQMITMSLQDFFGLNETIKSLRTGNIKLVEDLGDARQRISRLVVEQVAWNQVHLAKRTQSEKEAAEWKAKYEALLLKMAAEHKEPHDKSTP